MVRASFIAFVFSSSVLSHVNADDWPQWFGPQRDGIWREDGILTKFPADGVKPLWKKPLGAGLQRACRGQRLRLRHGPPGSEAN
jgi:hypothetical protein